MFFKTIIYTAKSLGCLQSIFTAFLSPSEAATKEHNHVIHSRVVVFHARFFSHARAMYEKRENDYVIARK